MTLDCLRFALDMGEEFGVWGGMAQGERLRFLKKIKSHRKGNWKEALQDDEYLEAKARIFHKQEEARLAKIARQQAAPRKRSATVVAITVGRKSSRQPGTRPVAVRNGGGRVAGVGGRKSASAPTPQHQRQQPQLRAASAGQGDAKRPVPRKR